MHQGLWRSACQRMILLRPRGSLRGARVLLSQYQQHQLQPFTIGETTYNIQNSGLRSFAKRSSTKACDGGRDFATACVQASLRGQPSSGLDRGTRSSRTGSQFSTTARPSRSQGEDEDDNDDNDDMSEGDKTQGKLGGEESRYNPALGRFPWEEKKDRQAELDDGDKVGNCDGILS